MRRVIVVMIRVYQVALSPILPFNQCRFLPSCSEYAIEALERHGTLRGGLLAIRRLLRCHPFHKRSGYDPVPDPGTHSTTE